MKKGRLPIVCIVALGCYLPSTTFSYYEDKVYCKVSKETMLVSLSPKDGPLCKTYVRSLELAMKEAYLNILAIQKHIDKKQDVGYWKALKEDRAEYVNSLQTTRLAILARMKTFEQDLLQQSKTFFLQSIVAYQKQLRSVVRQLATAKDSKSLSYLDLVKQQLATIDFLS